MAWTVGAIAVGVGLAAVGVGLATVYLAVARRGSAQAERRWHGLALVVVALIYVGFALLGNPDWLDLELLGVALVGALAWAGVTRDPLWLAAGWAAHMLPHGGRSAVFMPAGYAALCVGSDLVVAVYVLALRRRIAAG
ncbi:MAG: hypothetical protein AAGG50_06395 [Bacteroidota bacterium]